jgi:SAM-dependent methyltransferase
VEQEEWIACGACDKRFAIRAGIPHFVDGGELDAFEQEERAFHSQIADRADGAHGQGTLRAEQLHDGFLAPILDLPGGSLVLDVACGTGIDVVRLAEAGYRVIGMDLSPGMVAIAQRKVRALGLSERAFVCVANARRLPLRDARFDAALICAALHHMQDPAGVLSELARVTRPDGAVAIGAEPNAWIYGLRPLKHSRLGRRWMRLWRDDYTIGDQPPGDRAATGWTAENWVEVTRGTGLALVQVDPVWYLNGIASVLGLHALPRWLEAVLCRIDALLAHAPLINRYSMKWNVIARRVVAAYGLQKGGQAPGLEECEGC